MTYKKFSMQNLASIALFFGVIALTIGCGEGRGFALPEGDIAAGKTAFTKFKCNDCHSTNDIKFIGTDEDLHIRLGGEVSSLKSYGELVTSVINPSHKVAKRYRSALDESTQMKSYNDVITVQELVDIVTYLQSEYEIVIPDTYGYPY